MSSNTPSAANFDQLPDSALIDMPHLKVIAGKSNATIYRWIENGILPKPRKFGPTRNYWTAGEIRQAFGMTSEVAA